MNIAQGSLEECRYYLILARDLEYGETQELLLQIEEVSRLLESYAAAILTPGSWLLAPDSWLLAPGSWLLAPGSWLLAPDS